MGQTQIETKARRWEEHCKKMGMVRVPIKKSEVLSR